MRRLLAFSDGSGTTQDRAGGSGVVIYDEGWGALAEASYPWRTASNNFSEIGAIGLALVLARQMGATTLDLYTDSEFARMAILDDAFDTRAESLMELIYRARAARRALEGAGCEVGIYHVKGHRSKRGIEDPETLAMIDGNARADKLAGIARHRAIARGGLPAVNHAKGKVTLCATTE